MRIISFYNTNSHQIVCWGVLSFIFFKLCAFLFNKCLQQIFIWLGLPLLLWNISYNQ